MDKQNVIGIYNEFSHKEEGSTDEFLTFIDLENIMLSEISPTQNKYLE